MSEWKTIDTAPRDGTVIIGFEPEYYDLPSGDPANEMTGVIVLRWDDGRIQGGAWVHERHEYYIAHPTHWQPLPAPPEA